MNKKEEQIYINRFDKFRDRIAHRIIIDSIPFKAEYYNCKEPVAFSNRLDGNYQKINAGEIWGQAWQSAWFHLEGSVPDNWSGGKIVAHLDFGGEGLVYKPDGEIIQGITNGSVFDADFSRDIVHLDSTIQAGDKIELWVETAANGLFGVITNPDPGLDAPDRYGIYDARVKAMSLALFDSELWHLWLDLKILIGLVKTLPEDSIRRSRIIRYLNKAIDVYADTRENLDKCNAILKRELNKPASASDLTVTAVGHAHIDTAWLWPVSETVRKCARTFANQLKLIDEYPEYVFGASQPQHYLFVKNHYPELYEKIKSAVKSGRWEPQGGMWVEADCNIISGESMIRQILHGKNFFKDEFDYEVENLWLPDVFGYSPALPQIMQKSGLKYFLTQKLTWNQINEFPHHTFIWRGIDSREVLAHFPPENNYNSQLGTDFLVPAQTHFKEKDRLDQFLSLFGVGDGGGGPKEENIELGRRMADLEGSPRVKFGRAHEYFDWLDSQRDKLKTWDGELYLELHRGTLTSQARVKKANRELELKLRALEMLWSTLPLDKYPHDEINEIWKTVLINQFHDIIPGSSITKVYQTTHKEHTEALEKCEMLFETAAEQLFGKDNDSLVLFNSLACPYDNSIALPEGWTACSQVDKPNDILPAQDENGKTISKIHIEPYSFLTLKKLNNPSLSITLKDSLILENGLVKYEFNSDGRLISAYDKETRREIMREGDAGNLLTLYDDHPNNWDAWDIDIFYEGAIVDRAKSCKNFENISGPVRSILTFGMKVGNSCITQKIILTADSKRLDFNTEVDWQEKHRMLRVSFPVNVSFPQASFDIQYGYIKRPTHCNTSWDKARFETVGHRYADLSDNEYGVTLLNNCKYGYKVHDNILDLNLLRSPNYPDPDADIGHHKFTYSLLPHQGDLIHSRVIAEAAKLNQGIEIFNGYKFDWREMPISIDGDGISLEVVKKAEKENCLILRLLETKGRGSRGRLYVKNNKDRNLIETSLMEWKDERLYPPQETYEITLKPFEIKTYKLKG
ncbi:MAG: glycoside hydrolase family 38 C-terminal domain-containing protein [candidate division Zixibacteria bacterium]